MFYHLFGACTLSLDIEGLDSKHFGEKTKRRPESGALQMNK